MTVDDLLSHRLPSVDHDIRSYISGILRESVDDFETADDVYCAVGELASSHSSDAVDDAVIRQLCDDLFMLIRSSTSGDQSGPIKRLEDEAVSVICSTNVPTVIKDEQEPSDIWMIRPKDGALKVDRKKLEKAEAKIRQKQEKKSGQPMPTSAVIPIDSDCATANQAASRRDDKLDSSNQNNSCDIRIENIDLSYADKQLLVGADLLLSYGRRYGLVGRNGIGKTTLLRALSNGQLRIPSHIRCLHVEQEVVGDDTPILESVLKSNTKREELLAEERQIQAALTDETDEKVSTKLSERLAHVYEELAHMGADQATSQAATILFGLGFSPQDQMKPTREFSGGWRMRLALARALFLLPDLLLLDEPTNMLDMKAICWLENYLENWPTSLLVVSHDRSFLNEVATDILHVHSKRLEPYRGNYDSYERVMTEKLKNQQKEYEAQKLQREHTQKFIDKFRYNANRASSVQSKIKMLEKLPELQAVETEPDVVWRFPPAELLNPPVMQLDEITFYYDKSRVLLNKVILNADMDSRICIVGDNGSGKTTLLKIILGDLQPVLGNRQVHRLLRIGYFTQHFVDQLVMNVSPVELAQQRYPGKPLETIRASLGRFGITGDLALQPIASLSGGQKSRLAFALICINSPNFLILDEPTNHLDIETVAALGKALNEFEGGVMLVSHDETLIDLVCKELWVVKNGKVRRLEGGLPEYKAIVHKELAAK